MIKSEKVNFEPGESMRKVLLHSVTQGGCSEEKNLNTPKRSQTYDLLATGAHNPKRAISMRSCHVVFMDQFIIGRVLAQIFNIF